MELAVVMVEVFHGAGTDITDHLGQSYGRQFHLVEHSGIDHTGGEGPI